MAWGGYANGRIPLTAMRCPSWASSQYLYPPAAAQLESLNAAYRARFGSNIRITDSYRDYDGQVSVKARKGKFAATPGTSNHGWGKALDLGGNVDASFTTPQHLWMRDNGPRFGWIHPTWAHDHNGSNGQDEPWHFEYVGGAGAQSEGPDPDPASLPDLIEEDDMATLIWNGTYGYGILDGGKLALIGDQSTVDAWSAAGIKRVTVSNSDFMRMLRSSNNTFLIFCGTRGYGLWSGGKGVGIGSQATVDQFATAGCPQISVDAADFDRFMA
jgi:hypothetical protein